MSAPAWFAVAVLGWFGLLVGVALLVHGRAWVWMRAREMRRSLRARVRAEHALLSLALAAPREPRAKAGRTGAARPPA